MWPVRAEAGTGRCHLLQLLPLRFYFLRLILHEIGEVNAAALVHREVYQLYVFARGNVHLATELMRRYEFKVPGAALTIPIVGRREARVAQLLLLELGWSELNLVWPSNLRSLHKLLKTLVEVALIFTLNKRS